MNNTIKIIKNLIGNLKKMAAGFVIILFSIQHVTGQTDLPKVVPPSPEASSLGKFADMPVGFYTGIPQINIPIYNIPINGKSIPISLSYHASGIKVSEIPSSVGAGWALNAGGVITRTVRGKVDEHGGGYIMSPAIPSGNNCLTSFQAQDYLWETSALNHFDTEPDMFYFNFNGVVGKFVVDKNRKIHQIPYSNLKIEPTNTAFSGWKITTEEGVEYDFNTTEMNSETLTTNGSYISSWYLSAIKYPNSDQVVTFEYATDNIFYDFPISELRYEWSQYPFNNNHFLNVGTNQPIYSSNLLYATRLTKINFPNGTVEFIPGNYRKDYTNGRTLGQIKISNTNGLLKNFRFSYQYLSKTYTNPTSDDGTATSTTPADTKLRLFLKSIQEYAADNTTTKNPYVFDYNTTVGLPDRMQSKAIDHWGYYNGQDQNTTLIPTHINYNSTVYQGAIRDPYEQFAKAGILTQITYPTGGNTQFTFEGNQSNTNLFAGGVPNNFNTGYIVGNCHIASVASFVINDDFKSAVTMNIGLRTYQPNDTYTITRKVCGDNATGPLPTSTATYIYFQIIDISDPASPKVFYNSATDNWSIGPATAAFTKQITIPNGTYRIKAIRGNSNLSVNAPEITDNDANFTSRFIFEIKGTINTLQPDGSTASLIGGLRIKQMRDYDPVTQKSITKSYDYTDNGKSSGLINWMPVYDYQYVEDFPNTFSDIANYYTVYTSGSNAPLTEMQGGNVGYSKVTVSTLDDQNQTGTNGKTEYYFTNPKDFYFNPYTVVTSFGGTSQNVCFVNRSSLTNSQFRYPFAPGLNPDWSRGLLLNKIDYVKNTDGSFAKVKEIVNKYKDDYLGPIYDYNPDQDVMGAKIAITRRQSTVDESVAVGPYHDYTIQYYYIPSRYAELTETDEISYGPSAATTTVKKFNYDNLANLNPTSSTVTDSKKDVYKAVFKYPTDFSTTPVYASMITKNMISAIVQSDNYKNDVFLNQLKTNYGTWANVIAPSSIQTTTLNNPVDLRLQYNLYNSSGNILDVSKAQGIHIGYLWAYNNQYPIAECKNATNNEFYYEGYEESSATGVTPGTAHTGSKYTTNPAVTWTKPNSRTYVISYWYLSGSIWKYSGEQPYTLNNYTMQAAPGYDDVRIYPADAQMTTYTYTPLIGLTSTTDAKGETEYYEYDGFQRLINVKDKDGYIVKHTDYHYQGQ